MTDELLTVEEVARELRVAKLTVYRAVENGRLAAVRLGSDSGRLRIPRSAVSDYLRPVHASAPTEGAAG